MKNTNSRKTRFAGFISLSKTYLDYFGKVSLGIILSTDVIGAGICQFDKTKKPAEEIPNKTKPKKTIRFMKTPLICYANSTRP